jgi:hypothetical protein
MQKKLCCPECFDDLWLRRDHFPSLDPEHGKCDYCGTSDVLLVEPSKLADVFGMLVNVYEADPEGKTLVELMKADWQIFPEMKLDAANASQLLGDIFDDGNIVRKRFSTPATLSSEALDRWQTLRDELKCKNRWFLEQDIDHDRLGGQLNMLIATGLPEKWHRARKHTGDKPFTIYDMGAPPAKLASQGRANPAGIPYLYLASQPDTAIAEIRPHTGEIVYIAEFDTSAIRAVDLREPRRIVSPFLLEDSIQIGQLLADLRFLEQLAAELTSPVLPQRAAVDYSPSQYLCEFIKKKGFDGVLYLSSVGNGFNLALFDPSKATGGDVFRFRVGKVDVTTIPHTSTADPEVVATGTTV